MSFAGGCLCGSVRYEINAPILSIFNCHCTTCRKWQGSAFVTLASVPRVAFTVTVGHDVAREYDASTGSSRWFCGRCGSSLYNAPHHADFVSVIVGTLDSEPGPRPSAHLFVRSKVSWFDIADEIPQFHTTQFGDGVAQLQLETREATESAQALFQQALDLHPTFTLGVICLATTHQMQGDFGWTDDRKESYRRAEVLARRAIDLEPTLGYAHALIASVLLVLQKFPEALDAAAKALELSPKDPDIAVQCASVWALSGRPHEALLLIEGTIAQHPAPPHSYFAIHGISLLLANKRDDALKALHKSLELKPDSPYCLFPLVVACVESGDVEKAKAHARFLHDQMPGITADDNAFVDRIAVPAVRARVAAAFRRAGL